MSESAKIQSKGMRDMTQGPIWSSILVFSIPIILGNLLQQLYNTVDGIVVGNVIDSNALSAISNCATISGVIIAIAIGFSTGCGIIIAQMYGAGKNQELKTTISTGLILVIVMGIVVTVLSVLLNNFLLQSVLGLPTGAVLDYATGYLRIYSLGYVFTFAYNIVAYTLRGFGDSSATLYFLAVASVANLVLDIVMVPALGINGAAAATVIAQFCCMAASVIYMLKRYPMLRFRREELVVDPARMKLCLVMGVPATLQQCSVTLGKLVLQRLINSYGEITMSACAVGAKIDLYAMIPMQGLQAGLSTFTGQNMGAGKEDRVRKALLQTEIMGLIIVVLLVIPAYRHASLIAGAFGLTGESLDQAVQYVRFILPLMPFFAVYRVATGVLQGAGDVSFTTFISLFALIAKLVFAYVMAFVFGAGYQIIWQSVLVDYTLSNVFVWVRYGSGKWKTKSERIVKNTKN